MSWTQIKTIQKELKTNQKLEEREAREQQVRTELLQNELLSLIRTTRNNKVDLANYSDWLRTNFGSNRKFLKFLATFDISEETPSDLKAFLLEYSGLMKEDISYQKYLKWMNNTIYERRPLIMVAFNCFYANLPEKKIITSVHKGIVAKAEKSKTSRAEDKGTNDEYKHIIKYADSLVNAFIKWNAGRLRRGMVANFKANIIGTDKSDMKKDAIPDMSKLKGVELNKEAWDVTYEKYSDSNQGINGQGLHRAYGFLGTYAFKYRMNQLTAFKEKQRLKAVIKANGKRLSKLGSLNKDISLIVNYLQDKRQYYLFKGADDEKTLRNSIKIAYQVLRAKQFSNFQENIRVGNETGYKQSKLFMDSFEKKLWRNEKLKASR